MFLASVIMHVSGLEPASPIMHLAKSHTGLEPTLGCFVHSMPGLDAVYAAIGLR